jgi:hypothetical protein
VPSAPAWRSSPSLPCCCCAGDGRGAKQDGPRRAAHGPAAHRRRHPQTGGAEKGRDEEEGKGAKPSYRMQWCRLSSVRSAATAAAPLGWTAADSRPLHSTPRERTKATAPDPHTQGRGKKAGQKNVGCTAPGISG